MPSYAVVSRERHADKAWLPARDHGFAAGEAVLPLVSAELARAAAAMPVAFIAVDGHFQPMALLSPRPGCNLFVAPDGRWLGGYVPAALRGYPFALLHSHKDAPAVLCVDEASGRVVETGTPGAEPFFAADGSPSAALRRMQGFLRQVETDRAATGLALAALAEADLIVPWPLEVETPEGRKRLAGLHRVDEARLDALGDAAFLRLRAHGALAVAYAQLLSMGQLAVFRTLGELQAGLVQAQAGQQAFTMPAMETLGFDWNAPP